MDPLRASESYGFKVSGAHSKLLIDGDATHDPLKPLMTAAFDTKAAILAGDQTLISPILGDNDVIGADYPRFYAFTAELRKMMGKYGGGTLVDECALRIAKWQARGCSITVLHAIRDALGIGAP